LKTTFGLISTKGVYPISPNYLDTVGPMARDVKGLVAGMELLQENFGSLYARACARHPSAKGIRIGLLRVPGTDPAIARAVDAALERAGFQVVPLDQAFLRAWKKAQTNGNRVATAASFYNNRALQKERGVGRRAKVAISFGELVFGWLFDTEEKRDAAIAERDAWRKTLQRTFENVDAIALPVLQRVPPRRNWILPGLFEGLFLGLQYTVAVNYAGVPALAIPIPLEGRAVPATSLQLIGPPNSEAELLNIGRMIEQIDRAAD
jgi:amidase